MTKEEIIKLFFQCGMWSNDSGYYEGHIVHIHEAMILYADQETSALRAENERLRGLINDLLVKIPMDNGNAYLAGFNESLDKLNNELNNL